MKSLTITWLAALFLGAAVSSHAQAGKVEDWIKAVTGTSIVTQVDIGRMTEPEERELVFSRMSQSNFYTRAMEIEKSALERLINYQVILQEFKRLEKERGTKLIPDSVIEEEVQHRIHSPKFGSREEFDRQLRREGMSLQEFRDQVRDDFIFEVMRNEFVPEPVISPHQVEVYYLAHQDAYRVADRVKLQVIVFNKEPGSDPDAVRGRADNVLTLLKQGAAFGELQKSYSQGPGSSSDEWRPVNSLNPAIRDGIEKLKTGQYTDVLETSSACFIVLLQERDPAHIAPLSDVRGEVELSVKGMEQGRRYDLWISRLKNRIFVYRTQEQ